MGSETVVLQFYTKSTAYRGELLARWAASVWF